MIKNIVFDIGDVLVGYSPDKYIDKLHMSPEKVDMANEILIKSKLWREYLNGNILVDELIEFFQKKFPKLEEEFKILLEKKHNKEIIYEIEENTKLLKELSSQYSIYLLSNITKETFECIEEKYDFMKFIKGGVYSYKVHISKPKEEIYKILLDKYHINPRETIYIDDKIKNVEVSRELGMIGIRYQNQSLTKEIGGILK